MSLPFHLQSPGQAERTPRAATEATGTAYDQVFLADNEWGDHLMEQVAAEWFAANPGSLFLFVYEHSGGSLTFAREGMESLSSANDTARFRPDHPRPGHWSRRCERRPVSRPDLAEVTDLS